MMCDYTKKESDMKKTIIAKIDEIDKDDFTDLWNYIFPAHTLIVDEIEWDERD
jgi:hypothetical protein